MDKKTVGKYGRIVIGVVVLSIAILFAAPRRTEIKEAVDSAINKLTVFVNNVLENVGGGPDGGEGDDAVSLLAPDFVKNEVDRVVSVIEQNKGCNMLIFPAISDMHVMGEGESIESYNLQTRVSAEHAGQAMALMTEAIDVDFVAQLGDLAWGGRATTIEQGKQSITLANRYLAAARANTYSFSIPGNHDALVYGYAQNGEHLSPQEVKDIVGDYAYKDFVDKKVRVIALNTSDIQGLSKIPESGDVLRMSPSQLQWFAETLDLSDKRDANDWSVVLLAHHPLDVLPKATSILQAYLTGTSYSTTVEGVVISCDFSGKNAATVLAQFHGHNHCLKVDYIHYMDNGVATPTSVKRITIPNASFTRNNERGKNGTTDWSTVEFGEETTYDKTVKSANDTALCLIGIDLDKKVAYVPCYGAGYDRIVPLVENVKIHTVTNHLNHVVSNNLKSGLVSGESYEAVLSAAKNPEHYKVNATVTMGGVDITASVYSNGNINIPRVTGDVVITASTTGHTNLLPTALAELGGSEIYNGIGYKTNTRMSSSGFISSTAGMCLSGIIPATHGDVIRIKNLTLTGASSSYFFVYHEDGTVSNRSISDLGEPDENGVYTFHFTYGAGIRFSVGNMDETTIITANEEIISANASATK